LRIVILVGGDRAGAEFLPDPLHLGDALVQSLQMFRRCRPPEPERVRGERHEGRAEQRRLGNGGASEQQETIGAGDDEGGIAPVSNPPDAIQRPFGELAESGYARRVTGVIWLRFFPAA
jgi:hypothetical protein